MKLYVVRHGETNMGKNKLIASVDEPLNSVGIKQAIDLVNHLRKIDIDLVFCSPIPRARHTLELLNLNENIPIIIDDRIKERNMSIYEKAPFDSLDWEEFQGINSESKYTELESMKEVYNRVNTFLNELRKYHKDKNILLITHGGVSRAIYWYFNGFDSSLFECKNCKIYEYII